VRRVVSGMVGSVLLMGMAESIRDQAACNELLPDQRAL